MAVSNHETHPEFELARWTYPVMFYAALAFLMLLAALLVLWIDVPRVVEVESDEYETTIEAVEQAVVSPSETRDPEMAYEIAYEQAAFGWGNLAAVILLALWPLFFLEQIVNFVWLALKPDPRGRDYFEKFPFWWASCLIPPLRLCARERGDVDRMWFPFTGWVVADRELRRRLEHAFSLPMIWIALLILPVLGIQFYFKERILDYPMLRFVLHFGTGLIWFAFACEFIVMVSVTQKKLAYCLKHWLDLAIILLPLISFLRTARILRATRLAKIGKLQQVTRLVRMYRLRGVAMRALRAMMLLEVLNRLLRTKPERRLAQLEEQYEEKQRELEHLRQKIEAVRESLPEQPRD